MKRFLAIILSCLMLLVLVPVSAVSAAEKETILIAGSDFQVSGNDTAKVEKLIDALTIFGVNKVECAFFVGDYTIEAVGSDQSQYGIYKLRETFTELTDGRMLFVQGNHDLDTSTGLAQAGNNDPSNQAYGVFVINEDQYREWGNNRAETEVAVNHLRSYLDEKYRQGYKKPIFVLCHVPLHRTNRKGPRDGDLIFDALNEYGEKGLNILFLYGHNHSGGYDDFMGGAAVYFKKGDSLDVCCDSNQKTYKTCTLHFTYMNAGYMGYYSTSESTTDNALTISVFRIQADNSVIITRYDRQGVHDLKSKGVWCSEYSQDKGGLVPNTLEYASSRRVTATDDVAVDTPISLPTTTTTSTEDETTIATQTTGAEQTPDVNAETPTEAPTTGIAWWVWVCFGGFSLLLIGAVVTVAIATNRKP